VSFSIADREHMARALRLAARGLNTTTPNPRVGCVLVKDGRVAGEGWHVRAGGPHAEIVALEAAGAAARGATAYVTLEPCCHHGRTPPCTDAVIRAGVSRMVYAAPDPNPRVDGGGARALTAAGIVVEGGLLSGQAEALNPGFILRHRRGWPLVRLKIAATLDGRTALADGRSQWLTGEAARRDVQRWRARSCAILTGSGTVLADDPALNVREADEDVPRQPLRVILDGRGRVAPTARILQPPGDALLVRDRPSLASLFRSLAERGINEVWVEAGATLSGALLAERLVDELIVYQAGAVLGASARPMFEFLPLPDLASRPRFRLKELRHIGDDLRFIWTPIVGERAR
jgi:diaminohydroxyphosphoribosylaminopyrimidine deaminase/5-amino-6-(5-phosphoribosylamino)uracil reductase